MEPFKARRNTSRIFYDLYFTTYFQVFISHIFFKVYMITKCVIASKSTRLAGRRSERLMTDLILEHLQFVECPLQQRFWSFYSLQIYSFLIYKHSLNRNEIYYGLCYLKNGKAFCWSICGKDHRPTTIFIWYSWNLTKKPYTLWLLRTRHLTNNEKPLNSKWEIKAYPL